MKFDPGTWRVGGILAVSRAFGDKLLKPYVVADPEIKVWKLSFAYERSMYLFGLAQ